jgi:D-tyrosyl-tRNA(Tyr) deacylase
MKAVLQRVTSASVRVGASVAGEIGKGLLVLVCAVKGDSGRDLEYLVKKLPALRIFGDAEGRMNLSLADAGGELLIVSQFTLAASTRKGNRPSFEQAEEPERAREMYEELVRRLREAGCAVRTGEFGAMMQVSLVNDGPVTIVLDSREATGRDDGKDMTGRG